MKRTRAALLMVCLAAVAAERGHAQSSRTTWTDYGGGPDNARYFTLDQINKSTLNQLGVAWTYPTADTISYVFNPVVVDNVIYVLAQKQLARRARCHHRPRNLDSRGPAGHRAARHQLLGKQGPLRSAAVVPDEQLPAGDRRAHGKIDYDVRQRRRGQSARRASDAIRRRSSRRSRRTPGKVFENLIILGSAAGENYMAPPGDLRAYDVVTGALVWQFHTIPHPGEFGYETWPPDAWKYIGGVNTWGEITVDPVRGIAYFPLGSPTYDFYGADRHGANLFGSSLLALNARTGKRLWHFQMVHHDLWDYDNVAAPQLTTMRRNGKTIDVVAQAGKTGFLYVFDRVTGEPMWPIEERRVPPSEIPGEAAWPTQPFPTAPPPFAPQRLTADDINPYILTPDERETWKTRIANARNDGSVHAACAEGHGVDSRRAGWRELGLHCGRSGQGHRLRVEHQRALDLQAEHRSAGARRRRPSRRAGGDRAGAHAVRAEVRDVPRSRPARFGKLSVARRHHRAHGTRVAE